RPRVDLIQDGKHFRRRPARYNEARVVGNPLLSFLFLRALALVPTPRQIEEVVLVLAQELQAAQGSAGVGLWEPPLFVSSYDLPEQGSIRRVPAVASPEDVV